MEDFEEQMRLPVMLHEGWEERLADLREIQSRLDDIDRWEWSNS